MDGLLTLDSSELLDFENSSILSACMLLNLFPVVGGFKDDILA